MLSTGGSGGSVSGVGSSSIRSVNGSGKGSSSGGTNIQPPFGGRVLPGMVQGRESSVTGGRPINGGAIPTNGTGGKTGGKTASSNDQFTL